MRSNGAGFRLVVKAQYEEQGDRIAKKWRVPELADMIDKTLDTQALVAQIAFGVRDAIQSGELVKGDKISPSQIVLPPEANPDLTILAFWNLERDGVLEKEWLRVPIWIVR
jgi:hypothetical protein